MCGNIGQLKKVRECQTDKELLVNHLLIKLSHPEQEALTYNDHAGEISEK